MLTAEFYDISLWVYLLIFVTVFVGSVIDALVGGGGLITIPTYLICGLPPHVAIGTNKINSTMGTVISTIAYYRKGFVEKKSIIPVVVATIAGAVTGSKCVLLISAVFLKYLMIGLLPFIVLLMLRKKLPDIDKPVLVQGTVQWIKLLSLVFIIGFYDGFYGAGTGLFLVIAFTYIMKMNVYQAAGNGKISNLASNCAALFVFAVNGNICYPLAIIATIAAVLGQYLGSGLLVEKGTLIVKPTMITVVSILLISTLLDLFR
jgi:uncharacterized membrane protein YfcA